MDDIVADVLNAVDRWMRDKADLEKCIREARYEAGYFCAGARAAEQDAREQFGAALVRLIDSRVKHGESAA